jgi:plastocyanin
MKSLWVLVVVGILVGLSLSGCGKGGYATNAGAAVMPPPAAVATPAGLASEARPATATAQVVEAVPNQVVVRNFAYNPPDLRVKPGTTVTWKNEDSVAHSATADAGGWDSGLLQQGQSWSRTFPTAGTFTYHCRPHPYMKGKIVVG